MMRSQNGYLPHRITNNFKNLGGCLLLEPKPYHTYTVHIKQRLLRQGENDVQIF